MRIFFALVLLFTCNCVFGFVSVATCKTDWGDGSSSVYRFYLPFSTGAFGSSEGTGRVCFVEDSGKESCQSASMIIDSQGTIVAITGAELTKESTSKSMELFWLPGSFTQPLIGDVGFSRYSGNKESRPLKECVYSKL